MVFPLPDDYSVGILQSTMHWEWFLAKGSSQTSRPRYTSDTVFDTFTWPQAPTVSQVKKVAKAAVKLRVCRTKIMADNKWNLRELYRTLELPGDNPIKDAQQSLDAAVADAYKKPKKEDTLKFLLALGNDVSQKEAAGEPVVAPGLPPCVNDSSELITIDAVHPPKHLT